MSSRIVHLHGGFDERHAAEAAITEGLFHLQSGDSYGCYTRRQWYPHARESDVITVRARPYVTDRLPDEPTDEFRGDSYWVSDYVVVLEKPDTYLYNLHEDVPTYPAEAAQSHGCMSIIVLVIAFWVTTGVAWFLKQGPWSLVWGVAAVALIMTAIFYEYRAKAFFAGIKGWWYVRSAIKAGRGTHAHYRELVAHLSESGHPVVADVNKQILRWL